MTIRSIGGSRKRSKNTYLFEWTPVRQKKIRVKVEDHG